MEAYYPVFWANREAGSCQVSREGLYTRFCCRMRLPEDGVVRRLTVCVGSWRRELGVLIPSGGAFRLDTRLPTGQIPAGEATFRLSPGAPGEERRFVPISPEEPFAYLSRLEGAYLAWRNGAPGAVLASDPGQGGQV